TTVGDFQPFGAGAGGVRIVDRTRRSLMTTGTAGPVGVGRPPTVIGTGGPLGTTTCAPGAAHIPAGAALWTRATPGIVGRSPVGRGCPQCTIGAGTGRAGEATDGCDSSVGSGVRSSCGTAAYGRSR